MKGVIVISITANGKECISLIMMLVFLAFFFSIKLKGLRVLHAYSFFKLCSVFTFISSCLIRFWLIDISM